MHTTLDSVGPLLAMAQPQAGAQPGPLPMIAFVVMIFGMFYFIIVLPTRRKQKQHTDMLEALKSGDKVVTSGGLYGTVVGVSEAVVQLRIAEQVKVDVAKSSITELRRDEG
jgi:preprotein translocase subunit YajC